MQNAVIFPVERCTPSVNPFFLQAAFQGGFSHRFFSENYALGHATALYIILLGMPLLYIFPSLVCGYSGGNMSVRMVKLPAVTRLYQNIITV
jgi:hypothetical protein